MFEHCVQDGQQFAHAGGESNFLGLTYGEEAVVEGMQHRIVANGDERRHVKRRADARAASLAGSLSAELATVATERRDTHECGDLFPGQRAELGQTGQ